MTLNTRCRTRRTAEVSHAFTTVRCRPLELMVIWLLVSSTLRLDDQINVAVEDMQEIENLIHGLAIVGLI